MVERRKRGQSLQLTSVVRTSVRWGARLWPPPACTGRVGIKFPLVPNVNGAGGLGETEGVSDEFSLTTIWEWMISAGGGRIGEHYFIISPRSSMGSISGT